MRLRPLDFTGYNFSDVLKEGLERYYYDRIPTSGFMYAVLSNDLFGALDKADSQSRQSLPDICRFIYNELPFTCWGSTAKVEAWLGENNK
jgi:hypothetical protein